MKNQKKIVQNIFRTSNLILASFLTAVILPFGNNNFNTQVKAKNPCFSNNKTINQSDKLSHKIVTPIKKTTKNPNEKSEIVFVTKTGKCYHKRHCHHLKQSCIKTNKSIAKNDNYSPCTLCFR